MRDSSPALLAYSKYQLILLQPFRPCGSRKRRALLDPGSTARKLEINSDSKGRPRYCGWLSDEPPRIWRPNFIFEDCCAGSSLWQYSARIIPGWICVDVTACIPVSRPSEPSAVQVIFDKAIHLVRLRRHRQARRYTLRIDAASREVVLTAPRGSIREARNSRRSMAAGSRHGSSGCQRPRLRARSGCAAARRRIASCIAAAARHGMDEIDAAAGAFFASPASRLTWIAGSTTFSNAKLARIEAASRRYAPSSALRSNAISVRDQSSRWGSCSSTGVLSFSGDSFSRHRSCLTISLHTRSVTSSSSTTPPRFWRLVKRLYPQVERAKGGWTRNGTDLHRYGLPHGAARSI